MSSRIGARNPIVNLFRKGVAIFFQLCKDADMDTNIYAQIPPWLVKRNRRIYELYEEGKKFSEIAKLYGMSRQRARQIWERERDNKQVAA